jgi:hypothetical protein
MDSHAMFLNCPAYMDKDGGTRCGLPAEVEYRYTMNSTDGPLESAKISCPRRHHFNAPIEYLTLPEQPTATTAPASPPPAPTVQSAPPHARREGEDHNTADMGQLPAGPAVPAAWAGIQLQMTSPPHTPTCPPGQHSPPTASRKPAPATT